MSISTLTSIISLMIDFKLFSIWYVILISGILIGPICSYLNIDFIIHKFLYDKLGFGKRIIEKTTLLKLLDSIFVGSSWWLSFQYLLLNPIFNWNLTNYNWVYLSVFIFGLLLKFSFARSYIYEENFELSSKTWRYQNFNNESIVSQIINSWKSYAYPSLHTIILLSGIFLGVFTNELYVLAILTILWLFIVNHHWFSDIASGVLLSYGAMLFVQQVL